MQVGLGKTVTFYYRLYDEAGTLIDASAENDPMSFVFGEGSIIPGLEREMAGMEPGDSKEVLVKPEDAYGLHDPNLVHQVPRERFEGSADLEVGMTYMGRTDTGGLINFKVLSINDENVEIDLNHPLAGVNLRFEVTIQDVT